PSAGPVIALFAGIPLLTLIAFLAKENGVLLPLLCLVLEIGCFQARPRAIKGFFGLTLLLPLAVGAVLFVLDPARLLSGYVRRDFDWQERLLSQARALCDYLVQIAVPNPSRMGIYTDDFPASTGLLSPPSTLLALLLLAGITVAAWRLRPRLPFLFVGWGIFLAGHALESSIVPLELYFEHRNYLPMLGVLYALVGLASMAIARLDEKGYRAGRLGAAAAVCVLAVFAFATHGRARTWRTQQALAEASVAAHPQSMRAWLAVVSDAIDRRDYARARSALGAMTRLEQPRARAQGYLNRVNLDCALAHAASPSDIRNAVAARPARVTKDESETFDLLDRNTQVPCAGISNRALAGAAATFADAAATQPDSLGAKAELRHAAARFYAREGDWPAALKQAELAWQPGMPAAASVLLVQAQLAAGDLAGAERTWRQATRRARPGDEAGLRWLQKQIEAARDRAREGQAPP
ncbi:MAG TPA: hypothetical protein VL251_08850, partial [Thermomonas sp.]|nr:hypothetical protein [Thermomonas sp.]